MTDDGTSYKNCGNCCRTGGLEPLRACALRICGIVFIGYRIEANILGRSTTFRPNNSYRGYLIIRYNVSITIHSF